MVSKNVASRRLPTPGAVSLRAVLLAVVLALGAFTLTGCDSLEKDLTCPGERCTKELAALRDQITALPDVAGVTSVEYHYGFDAGTSGVIVYRASPGDAATAKQLNHQVIDLYRHSTVNSENRSASRLTARMVWDPERYVQQTRDLGGFEIGATTPGKESGAECATTRCAAQVKKLARQLEQEVATEHITVHKVAFRGASDGPAIEVRLTSDLPGTQSVEVTRAVEGVQRLLSASGVRTSYREHILVTRPVQHSMVTDWDPADNSYNDVADRDL